MKNKVRSLLAFALCVMILLPTCVTASEVAASYPKVNLSNNAVQVLEQFNKSVVSAYEKKEIPLDSDIFVSHDLFLQLVARNDYIQETQSAYKIIDTNSDFNIDKVVKINNETLKVLTTRTIEQTLSYDNAEAFPFYSSTHEGFILKNTNDGWKIIRVVDEIYGTNLAMNDFVNEFDSNQMLAQSNAERSASPDIIQDLGGIDYLNLPDANNRNENLERANQVAGLRATSYMYSKARACNYALRWGGSNRNPAFNDYSYSGGDCANFTSQCLNAGGMTYTSSWSPDSYQFINVEGQRDMLINTGRADGCYQYLPTYPNNLDRTGTVVHYTDGSQWYHAVIITQDPMTSYSSIRVSGHTANVINGPIWPNINQIRSFRVH